MSDLTDKLVCYNGTVLVETIEEKAGNFDLPDSADKKPQKGKIVLISDTDDDLRIFFEWSERGKHKDKMRSNYWDSPPTGFDIFSEN